MKDVEVQAVADALEIHPFMLSRWRKEACDGVLRGRVSVPKAVKTPPARTMKRFQSLQRAHALLGEEHALLKTHPVHLRTKADVFAFIEQERETYGVTRLCRTFGVTRAGYYAWRQRPMSSRRRQDRVLLEEMHAIFEDSGVTYGSPRFHESLAGRGHCVSRRRVERLMRADGLRGRVARVYRPKAGTALVTGSGEVA